MVSKLIHVYFCILRNKAITLEKKPLSQEPVQFLIRYIRINRKASPLTSHNMIKKKNNDFYAYL